MSQPKPAAAAASEAPRRIRNAAEEKTRRELAACYRLAHHFNWDDIIWNHITARVPGPDNRFLLNRFGLRYDEVCASNLITLDQDGTVVDGAPEVNITGFVIHGGIYAARPEINCIMHTHTPGGMAMACLQEELVPLVNDVMMFHNRVAYHDYEGLSTERKESARITKALGQNHAMILRNHGLLTAGRTPGEAFVLMYYLERACRVQMDVLQSGRPYTVPSEAVLEHAAKQYDAHPPGKHEWPALLRLVEERYPGYRV